MRHFNIWDILYCAGIIVITIVMLLYSVYVENKHVVLIDVPELEDSIDELEEKMGEYSDYYVVVDKVYNFICHNVAGIEQENIITVLLPEGISEQNVILDFYTGWDAKLGSYKCDFEKYPEYKVNNKVIRCIKSEVSFIFIDVDKDAFNKVNASFSEDNPNKELAAIAFSGYDTVSGKQIKSIQGQIKPRGAVSWSLFYKRPYSIKLAEKQDLFGLGRYKKWNLIANGSDKTLLKNEIFYGMSDELGLQYSPKTEQVHLFINQSYAGVYTLTTKVDAFAKGELGAKDFLINWGSPNCKNKIEFVCNYETLLDEETGNPYFDLEWPDKTTLGENEYVRKKVQNLVDVLEGKKPENLSDYLDLDSMARYYWVQEISMNVDAFYRSFYMYYKADTGKFYAGSVWDMDCTLGVTGIDREGLDFTVPKGWKVRDFGVYKVLFENKEFREKVEELYYVCDIEDLMEETYMEYVDRVGSLEQEGELNYFITKDDNNYYDLDCLDVRTYRAYSDRKLEFFRTRIDWIKKEMESR